MKKLKDYTIEELFGVVFLHRERGVDFDIKIEIRSWHKKMEDVGASITITDGSYGGSRVRLDEFFDIDRLLLDLNENERGFAQRQRDVIYELILKTDKIIKGLLPQGENSNVIDVEE